MSNSNTDKALGEAEVKKEKQISIDAGGSTLPVNVLTLVLLNIIHTKHE